ncbi:hypothetical protein JCM10450v2_006190 [Rhodotorula kratochvilovae]
MYLVEEETETARRYAEEADEFARAEQERDHLLDWTWTVPQDLTLVDGYAEAVQNVLETDLAEEGSDEEGGPTPTLCSCCSSPEHDDWAAWEVANVECAEEKQVVVEGVESALDRIE